MTIPEQIGTRIRRVRINKDHTQEDLAKALHLTVGAYAKIERGETDPSITRLFELAKILKVDITAFLHDEAGVPVSGNVNSHVSQNAFDALRARVTFLEKKMGIEPTEREPQKKSVARKVKQR